MQHRQRKQPRLLLSCASARYVRQSSVCTVDSPWQPVNHYLWRLAWRSALTHSASTDGSNCSVLLVCPYRDICHFTHSQLLLNLYFQLPLLFISPRCTVTPSPSFPQPFFLTQTPSWLTTPQHTVNHSYQLISILAGQSQSSDAIITSKTYKKRARRKEMEGGR